MARVIFKFDEESDLRTQWEIARIKAGDGKSFHDARSVVINSKVLEICKNKEFEDCRDELRRHLFELYYNNPIFEKTSKSLEFLWSEVESSFFIGLMT